MAGELFADTSILISRDLGVEKLRSVVKLRLGTDYRSGSVCIGEYRRRIIPECFHMISAIAEYGYTGCLQAIPGFSQRASSIRIQIYLKEARALMDNQYSEAELTEKVIRRLRIAILSYLNPVPTDKIVPGANCSRGLEPLEFKTSANGMARPVGLKKECKNFASCGIVHFLRMNKRHLRRIKAFLAGVHDKTDELRAIETALDEILQDVQRARDLNLCQNYTGDLLVLLESLGFKLYTLNSRESEHLCRALGAPWLFRSLDLDLDDEERN